MVFNIYEPLVYVMDDGSEQFLMAESYEVSEDGRVYTFQLRSGVKFHNGEVMTADDVVFSLESAVADPYMATYISANSDYRSGSTTQDLVQWLVLNSEAAPLDDVRVRQAVYCAINKEDVLAIAANGAGTVANVMADPRIIAGATDDFPYLTFDQEKARSLLAEAGYPDGVDIGEITYMGGTSWEKIAAAVQSNLADVGITVTMKSMDASAIFSSLASGDFTVGVLGSGLGRDYSLYSQLYTMDYLDVLDMCRHRTPRLTANSQRPPSPLTRPCGRRFTRT